MDSKGRILVSFADPRDLPDWCKAGSNNPYAKILPDPGQTRLPGAARIYDPKTGKFGSVDTCLTVRTYGVR